MCSWRVFVNMAVDGRQVKEAGMIEEATAAVVAYKENVKHVHLHVHVHTCT